MRVRPRTLAPALFAGLLAAGCGADPAAADVLSGRVTLNGQPAKDVTVVVVGPDRAEMSALTGPDGGYRVVRPPKGQLQFRVTALAPPPPPGVKAPPAAPGGPAVPPKYAKPGNGLAFEYPGGKQTYDITLSP